MRARTRGRDRVNATATPAEKLAPSGAEAIVPVFAASGDPNVPGNADALAAIASRAFARVLSEMTGEAWIAA